MDMHANKQLVYGEYVYSIKFCLISMLKTHKSLVRQQFSHLVPALH